MSATQAAATVTASKTARKTKSKAQVGGREKAPARDSGVVIDRIRDYTIDVPKGVVASEPREASKRGQVLAMLRKGDVTISKLEKKFEWAPRDAMDALRLLARTNGIAIKVHGDVATLIK
jgi:hypothetical protein